MHPNNNLAVVIIPLYKLTLTESELFSIHRTLRILKDRPISIVCPNTLKNEFSYFAGQWGHSNINVDSFSDHYFKGITGYNALLKSKMFYEHYTQYEYMLIAQPDALILSDQLLHWCQKKYSYIGAPFFEGFANPTHPLKLIGVGNGGVSLRRIPDFIQAASQVRYIPNTGAPTPSSFLKLYELGRFIKHRFIFCLNWGPLLPKVNEDVFWGMLIPHHFDFFRVPTPEEAIDFAFDVEPKFLYERNQQKLPFACHAWERFDYVFWRDILNQQGIDIPAKK